MTPDECAELITAAIDRCYRIRQAVENLAIVECAVRDPWITRWMVPRV